MGRTLVTDGGKSPWQVTIGRLDDAAVRVGLGWHGVERPGGTLHGRDNCTAVLNRITSALEDDFCRELAKFERRSLVEAVVTNHEAAAAERTLWHRTSGALIGLAEDEAVIRSEIAEQLVSSPPPSTFPGSWLRRA